MTQRSDYALTLNKDNTQETIGANDAIASGKEKVTEVCDEPAIDPEAQGIYKFPQKWPKVWLTLGCCLLILSILGGALIGPSSNMLETENSLLKTAWANSLRFIYCVPLVFFEACYSDKYWSKFKSQLNRKVVIGLLVTPLFHLAGAFGLIFGSANLVQSHSYICNTLFVIFIVLIGYCLCLRPYLFELLGLAITISGIALMFSDPDAVR